MNNKFLNIVIATLLIVLFQACTEDKSEEYLIKESDMIDILVEMHLTDGMLSIQPFPYEVERLRSENLYLNVLQKKGVTRTRFDSALTQYSQNRKLYLKMYDKVIERLRTKENEILSNTNTKEEKERGYAFFQYSFKTNFDSFNTIDQSKEKYISKEESFSGKYAYKVTPKQQFSQSYLTVINHPLEVLEISVEALIHWKGNIDKYPKIVFLLSDKDNKVLVRKEYSMRYLKNDAAKWKKIKTKYELKLPHSQKDIRVNTYFWNPNAMTFYIDDYSLKVKQLK